MEHPLLRICSKTILDYFNEDCWNLVLGYVPLQDIIRTERASRQWQKMVLTYLSHTRICIKMNYYRIWDDNEVTGVVQNVRCAFLRETYMASFKSWTCKLGTSVVAGYCTEKSFNVIGENCPNLEGVTFLNIPEELLLNNQYENFRRLERLRFIDCFSMTDNSLSQYIASPVLEELLIFFNDQVTGQCFTNIRSPNFKSLDFKYCKALACRLLAVASHHFSELRKLVLECINAVNIEGDFREKEEPFDAMVLVLDKTTKLEYLSTWEFGRYLDNFFESVCQLSCLKELEIDTYGTDKNIAEVARRCPQLRILKFQACNELTGRGLRTACVHAGARLTNLHMPHNKHLTDNDVEACVRACPNLMELNVQHCSLITRDVLPRAAAARRAVRAHPPLRLLWRTASRYQHLKSLIYPAFIDHKSCVDNSKL
ncbi:uncharacterized protein LOC133516398 isoform X2 [Cydia pomonella]|uniref:uncharacterized protein LOC133516398 isoform X2 n=1 Tax=Cydia pomonella TaxID=82600 RepID=UPI002ADDF61B|nr:uncharacterized protein LOC133516398 isoform X2 [Cydia pomonella]